jgi:spermidine synthase
MTAVHRLGHVTWPDVGRAQRPGSTVLALPALLLFTSGAAALVYQILWIKQISLVVGVDVHAVTIGVSAFFAGLAVGSALLGRCGDRLARPFLCYALLELGIAVFGVTATLALARAASPFVVLEATAAPLAWASLYALVGVPAALMGGTLPVLIRSLVPQPGAIGAAGGLLYAANTVGAIASALLTPLVLLPLLGVHSTALAAAALNLVAAIGALLLDHAIRLRPATARPPEPIHVGREARVALVLYAIAGGIALGYEVVWSQAIVQFMSTRSFALAVVLATYLAGLAVGSALYGRWADRVRDPWGVFGVLIATAGLMALLEIAGLGKWLVVLQTIAEDAVLTWSGSQLAGMCARFAVAAAHVVFVPTLLLGAAFPVVLRLAVDARYVGRDVGVVVALNTVGGIAGTMLTGFVLVPVLGLVSTLAILAIAAAAPKFPWKSGAAQRYRPLHRDVPKGPDTARPWLLVADTLQPTPFLRAERDQALLARHKALEYSPDGSLTIYVQADAPPEAQRANWLPAPKDVFNLFIRLYWLFMRLDWPQQNITDGICRMPLGEWITWDAIARRARMY